MDIANINLSQTCNGLILKDGNTLAQTQTLPIAKDHGDSYFLKIKSPIWY